MHGPDCGCCGCEIGRACDRIDEERFKVECPSCGAPAHKKHFAPNMCRLLDGLRKFRRTDHGGEE